METGRIVYWQTSADCFFFFLLSDWTPFSNSVFKGLTRLLLPLHHQRFELKLQLLMLEPQHGEQKSHDSRGSSIRPLAEERAVRWGQPTKTNSKTQGMKPLQVKILKVQLKNFFKEIKKLLCSYTDRFLNQPLFFQHLMMRSVCLGSLGSDPEMTSCPRCVCLGASRKTSGIF